MYFGQQFHCKSDQCTELKSFLGLRNQVCLFVPEYIHANFTVKQWSKYIGRVVCLLELQLTFEVIFFVPKSAWDLHILMSIKASVMILDPISALVEFTSFMDGPKGRLRICEQTTSRRRFFPISGPNLVTRLVVDVQQYNIYYLFLPLLFLRVTLCHDATMLPQK